MSLLVAHVFASGTFHFINGTFDFIVHFIQVPPTLEIGYVPFVKGGQFPGLFLFTTPARMMRPVRNLITGATELIGSFEQIYMEIAVDTSEIYEGVRTRSK